MTYQKLTSEPSNNKIARPGSLEGRDQMEGSSGVPALRVYLVEDSAHVRELLLDFLQVPGEVEIVGYADNEAESMAAMIANPVDAVIVDLKLRQGSGMGVIEQLRRAHLTPSPKIIVFTNHPFPEIRKRAMQLGADYFFDKSADYDSVRSTLQSLRTH